MSWNFAPIAKYSTPKRIGLFVLLLLILWVPIALPIRWLVQDPNLATLYTIPLLYSAFLLLVLGWGKWVYRQPNLLQVYGLRQPRRSIVNFWAGLSLGLSSLLLMFFSQGLLGWLAWQPLSPDLPKIIGEGLLVAIGYGLAEELLFRGWLLDELQRGYRPSTVLWVSSGVYALLHCIRPLQESIQFPALVILGMTLVWAKRACAGRLGMPIGLHAGLIWGYYIVNVGRLVQYNPQIPEAITGVGHNPLAGGMGVICLSLIAVGMRRAAIGAGSHAQRASPRSGS